MCWLPVDQPWLQPGDTTCSSRRPSPCSVAQLLASRLRRIGDQLEKSWTAGERHTGMGFGCRERERGTVASVSKRGHLKGFLCMAVHFTALVLFVARRHL